MIASDSRNACAYSFLFFSLRTTSQINNPTATAASTQDKCSRKRVSGDVDELGTEYQGEDGKHQEAHEAPGEDGQ